MGARDVLRPDSCRQAVDRVIGNSDHLLFVVERDDCCHRPEYLLAHEAHFRLYIGEHRWLDKIAGTVEAATAGHDLDILAAPFVNEAHDSVQLLLTDEW